MAWGAGAALPECRWARSSAGSGRGSGGCRTAVHHSLIAFGFFASGFPYFTPFKLRKQLSPLILHFRIKIRFQGFPVIRASRELWYRRPRSALALRTGGGVWRRTRPLTHQTPAGRWLCSGPAEDTAVRSVSKPAPFSHLLSASLQREIPKVRANQCFSVVRVKAVHEVVNGRVKLLLWSLIVICFQFCQRSGMAQWTKGRVGNLELGERICFAAD